MRRPANAGRFPSGPMISYATGHTMNAQSFQMTVTPDLIGHDIIAVIPEDFRLQSGQQLEQSEVIARVYGPKGAPVVVAAGGPSP